MAKAVRAFFVDLAERAVLCAPCKCNMTVHTEYRVLPIPNGQGINRDLSVPNCRFLPICHARKGKNSVFRRFCGFTARPCSLHFHP